MVEDAVRCEPISTGKFPANREINREFRKDRPSGPTFGSDRRTNSIGYRRIPYAIEQGILKRISGNCFRETGNFVSVHYSACLVLPAKRNLFFACAVRPRGTARTGALGGERPLPAYRRSNCATATLNRSPDADAVAPSRSDNKASRHTRSCNECLSNLEFAYPSMLRPSPGEARSCARCASSTEQAGACAAFLAAPYDLQGTHLPRELRRL
jgi:hypothetical protein